MATKKLIERLIDDNEEITLTIKVVTGGKVRLDDPKAGKQGKHNIEDIPALIVLLTNQLTR